MDIQTNKQDDRREPEAEVVLHRLVPLVGDLAVRMTKLTLCLKSAGLLATDEAQPAGRPIPKDEDALLYEAEAAHLLAQSIRTLQAQRIAGDGPRFVKAGRSIRYARAEIRRYAEARLRRSTGDPGGAESLR